MELYCFSATGNTLSTARLLAQNLGEDCRIISIPALLNQEKIIVNDDSVGFLFPIYNGDMPYILRDFISRIEFSGNPYIFSVCTFRGYSGAIAARLNTLLAEHGQKLSLSLGVKMPGNSRLSTAEETEAALSAQEENVKTAAKRISARETEDYSSIELPAPSPFTNGYENTRGMVSDENCIGCGICTRVCPTGNITVENGHSVFGNKCATCLSCFHWCPVEAIYMSKTPDIARRFKYHHPDVTLQDIIAQKNP